MISARWGRSITRLTCRVLLVLVLALTLGCEAATVPKQGAVARNGSARTVEAGPKSGGPDVPEPCLLPSCQELAGNPPPQDVPDKSDDIDTKPPTTDGQSAAPQPRPAPCLLPSCVEPQPTPSAPPPTGESESGDTAGSQ
jgi:hypothetical protein